MPSYLGFGGARKGNRHAELLTQSLASQDGELKVMVFPRPGATSKIISTRGWFQLTITGPEYRAIPVCGWLAGDWAAEQPRLFQALPGYRLAATHPHLLRR